MTVTSVLSQLGLTPAEVVLGHATVEEELTPERLDEIRRQLEAVGFEVIDDRDTAIVERARIYLTRMAREGGDTRLKLSAAIDSAGLGADYKTLSRLFSEREGRTLERYLISQKIEYVKEMLDYGELTLSEIAWRAGYSSVAHLSRQFKTETGMTASDYKALAASGAGRRPLDKV